MQCNHCGYPASSVVYTRHNDFKNLIERRRECTKCGKRFTTHEQIRQAKISNTTPPYLVLPK